MTTAVLRFSDNGIQKLKNIEGWRSFVYDDATGKPLPFGEKPKGNPTIGYGHKLSNAEYYANGITRPHGDSLLRSDVLETEIEVRDFCDTNKIELTQNQFDATVLLIFNCGSKPLHEGFGEFLKAHRWRDAADRMLCWNKVENEHGVLVVIEGLTARRTQERALFLTP